MSNTNAVLLCGAILLAFSLLAQVSGQQVVKPAVQKWEYKVIPLGALVNDPKSSERVLNQSGQEGWELCGAVSPNIVDGPAATIFKRPKQ